MAQADYTIDNASGATVRADINATLAAIVTQNSGASAPATTFAHMLWADTTNGVLKRRNAANSGWIVLAPLASAMVQAKAANYTVALSDFGTLIDCSGTFTLSLTAAATLGDGFWFAVRNSGTGTVTIDPDGSETIDGAATITLYPGDSAIVWCNGTAFKTVGRGGWEEGSWTPAIAGSTTPGTQTYAIQTGRYIRQGNLVTAWFTVQLSAKDGATAGNISITGLPFTASNISTLAFAAALGNYDGVDLSTGKTQLAGQVHPNTSQIVLRECGDNVNGDPLTAAAIGNSFSLSGEVTYRIG